MCIRDRLGGWTGVKQWQEKSRRSCSEIAKKNVKKLHEDFGNIFSTKSGLNWDVDASSDESSGSGDDQPMDAHGSEDVQVENAEPKEGVSAPEGAEGNRP